MRSRIFWILMGFALASFAYSIMLSCGKSPTETGNAGENGVVRVVYMGIAVDTTGALRAEVSVPELTLNDPPAISYYKRGESNQWRFDEHFDIAEGKVTVSADTDGEEYKIVVIK